MESFRCIIQQLRSRQSSTKQTKQKMANQIYLDLPGGAKLPAFGLGTLFANDEAELENALITAIETGYRHIDTATLYQNEAIIGRALKKLFDAGKLKREDIFITTKLPPTENFPEKVEECLKKSLESLQLDYVDLYLVHHPVPFTKIVGRAAEFAPKSDHVGIWKKMEQQVDAKRAKFIGLSNFNIPQIENILKSARIKPANLQIEVYLYFQQKELLEFCKKKGISVVAYGPLASPQYFQNIQKEATDVLKNPVVEKIAKKHGKTTAQVLLRHLLQKGISVIPKSTNPDRIKQNFNVFNFKLDDGEVKNLDALDMGPKGRIFSAKDMQGIEDHPDYPFK